MQDDERRHLQEFVMLINNNIRQFEMEIKKGVSEADGSSCYGLVRPKINYFLYPQREEFVMLINNNIRQFEMEIKKGVSETDGSSCY